MGRLFIGTVFAQAVQVLTLRLGFNLATALPPLGSAGLLQPILGIAVLALALKIPGLMGAVPPAAMSPRGCLESQHHALPGLRRGSGWNWR